MERFASELEERFFLSSIPVVPVDVGNVAEWYFCESQLESLNLREMLPCCISPFRFSWYEYLIPKVWNVRPDGKTWVKMPNNDIPYGSRFAMLIMQDTLPEGFTGNTPEEASYLERTMIELKDWKPPRFVQYTTFILASKEQIKFPLSVNNYLDEDGRMLSSVYAYDNVWMTDDQMATFFRTFGYSVYFSISLMHCKNVRVDDSVSLPEKVIKKRQKEGKPTVRYKTIYIDSIKQQSKQTSPGSSQDQILRAIDIMRGHWKDYTQGRGLFGKLHGRFWWSERVNASVSAREYKMRFSPPSQGQ